VPEKRIRPISDGERKMCLGKTVHKSVLAAETHLDELRRYSKTPQTLNWYKCHYCKFYHVGNK
jgi:hypothetical protein